MYLTEILLEEQLMGKREDYHDMTRERETQVVLVLEGDRMGLEVGGDTRDNDGELFGSKFEFVLGGGVGVGLIGA